MGKQSLISVEQLTRYYGDYRAVSNLTFSLQSGEVLGMLGPNGAGKTTTLQIIAGVLAASAGRVSIAGYDIVEQAQQAKQHIGYLPEQPPLYPDQTVDEYLRFCARLHRLSGGAIAGAVDLCKQRCGLSEVGKRLIGNLSRGYQQRVGIAQAIVHSPAVVVLDEPTVGLDPIQIIEIRALIRALDKDHAVILSTHILTEVQSTCDRVLIINEGSLVLDENIRTLQSGQQHYRFSIALKCPPDREQLVSVSGISGVDCVDRNHFYINCRDNLETPARLAELAAASGWGLYELIPVKDSLEDTFLRLTSGAVTSRPLEAD